MKKLIKAGATSQTIDIFIQDSTSTTGAGKTGLVYNTASLTAYYRKGATGTATAITLATQTVGGAYSSGGFVEIDGTNMPGMYRLDLPNAVVDTAGSASLMLKGATGMAPCTIELQMTAFDLETSMDAMVDLIWDEVLTGAAHNVVNSAGRRIRQMQEAGGYSGYIWIDTIGGTAGTTSFENGTDTEPVSNIANANTLATNLTISQFMVAAGSSITFAATQSTQVFTGENWTLALGGQDISSTHIRGATVSGVCTGTGVPEFHECHIGNVTVPATHFKDCHIEGTVTLPAATVHFEHCSGNGATVLEFGAGVGNTTVNMTDFSGEITINNLGASGTDVLSIRGHGKIIFAASCVGGTVKWDGHFDIVNNGSGLTITGDDIYDNTVNIQSRLPAALSGGKMDSVVAAADIRSAVGLASANLDTQLDALPTAVENADTLLDRNMATGTDSGSPTVRTVRQALRALRNKWTNSAGTYTVTKEDDTTTSWTSTITTDAAANPITGSDPA